MARISDVEIARLAYAAGFRQENDIKGGAGKQELMIMVAVAIGESKGDSHAHNDNSATGDDSYGLWQVNMLGDLGPYRRQKYGLSNNSQLFDPATNARVAYGIYSTEGKLGARHWSVFNSQTYRIYIERARAAVKAMGQDVPDPDLIPGLPGTQNPDDIPGLNEIQAIGEFFSWLSDGKNWQRVGLFLGGGVLLLGGLIFAFGREVDVRKAANLIPAGRALRKVAGK